MTIPGKNGKILNLFPTYLRTGRFDSVPIEARENILEKRWVVLHFKPLELGVAKVEGEGERGCFAGLDGASEEVDGEDFHGGPFGICGEVPFFFSLTT